MYKGFTLKRYRGQRLHAIGMTRALEHYLSRGFALCALQANTGCPHSLTARLMD
jgi:hypothetical protein